MCTQVWTHGRVSVCVCRNPLLMSGVPFTFHHVHWDKVSKLNSKLADEANLYGKFTRGVCLWVLELQNGHHAHVGDWDPNSITHPNIKKGYYPQVSIFLAWGTTYFLYHVCISTAHLIQACLALISLLNSSVSGNTLDSPPYLQEPHSQVLLQCIFSL